MIRLLVISLIVILSIPGCGLVSTKGSKHSTDNQTAPLKTTSEELRTSINNSDDHAAKADSKLAEGIILVEKDEPKERVLPPLRESKSELTQARESLVEAKTRSNVLQEQLKEANKRTEEKNVEIYKLGEQITTLKGDVETAKNKEKAAEEKYDEAWLGGKTWSLIYWVSGLSLGLLIVCLVLNAKTNIFVGPFHLLGRLISWLFTPSN